MVLSMFYHIVALHSTASHCQEFSQSAWKSLQKAIKHSVLVCQLLLQPTLATDHGQHNELPMYTALPVASGIHGCSQIARTTWKLWWSSEDQVPGIWILAIYGHILSIGILSILGSVSKVTPQNGGATSKDM